MKSPLVMPVLGTGIHVVSARGKDVDAGPAPA